MEVSKKVRPHFGKNGWVYEPYGKIWTGQWPKLLNISPVIFSGFLDAIIKQFLSKEKLLRKAKLSLETYLRVLVFDVLAFEVLVFGVLAFDFLKSFIP